MRRTTPGTHWLFAFAFVIGWLALVLLVFTLAGCSDPAFESEKDADTPGLEYYEESEQEFAYSDEEQEIIDFVDDNFNDVNQALRFIDQFMEAMGDDGIEAFTDSRTDEFVDITENLLEIAEGWQQTPQPDELDDPDVIDLEDSFNIFMDETAETYIAFGEMLEAVMEGRDARARKLAESCGAHSGMAEIARDDVKDIMRDF